MESELETIKPNLPYQPEASLRDNNSTKDDRPLLKLDSGSNSSDGLARNGNPSIEELENKYAAYVRRDVYGVMGRGELPWMEKVLLGVASFTLLPIRLLSGMIVLVNYYFICRICTAFSPPNREEEQEDYAHMVGWRREVIVRSGRFLSRVMLFIFGFYWIRETSQIDVDDDTVDGKLDNEVSFYFSRFLTHL